MPPLSSARSRHSLGIHHTGVDILPNDATYDDVKRSQSHRAWLAFLALALTACATRPMPESSIDPYLAQLKKLDSSPSRSPSPSAAVVDRGVENFKTFFGNMSEESVRTLTRKTYAPDIFFNDSLKTVRGVDALEHYFLETVKNAESVRATVEDVSVSGDNVYLRWTMEIRFAKFKRGQTFRSIGVTHLRFDDEGLILLHQDYWDSTSGFFEHVPGLGGILRAIKSRL